MSNSERMKAGFYDSAGRAFYNILRLSMAVAPVPASRQLYLPSLSRYFLPLPKLSDAQLTLLCAHLEGRGFGVKPGRRPEMAGRGEGGQRIAIDGALGLATSASDLLDAVGPAIPTLLALGSREVGRARADAAPLYLSLKRSGASSELQLFPRLESLRTWSCLRKDGLCGLTPDEAAVLKHVLRKSLGLFTSRMRDSQAEAGLKGSPGGEEALLQVGTSRPGVPRFPEDIRLRRSRLCFLPAEGLRPLPPRGAHRHSRAAGRARRVVLRRVGRSVQDPETSNWCSRGPSAGPRRQVLFSLVSWRFWRRKIQQS